MVQLRGNHIFTTVRTEKVCKVKIKILLADSQKDMREALRSLLEKYEEFDVACEAENGESAVALAHACKPDVVVMDVAMPDLSGTETANRIITKAPDAKVIALSMNLEKHTVMELLKAGTSGYLMKERACEELIDAIREVVAGNIYLSPSVVGLVLGEYVHRQLSEQNSIFSILTPREREVLQHIAEGRSTAQIANDLDISTNTVETHRKHLMDKLNIWGIADLTRYAIRAGITQP
jgi:DNA-binding NarL/FixJ family response regulator